MVLTRFLAQVISLSIAACPAVKYSMLNCSLLERTKTKALTQSNNDYVKNIMLPGYISDD